MPSNSEDRISLFFNSCRAVIITGASSGIGEEYVKAISNLSVRVPICNLSRTEPETFSQVPQNLHIRCDLSEPEQIEQAVAKILPWLDGIDRRGKLVLINNSGYGRYGPFPGAEDPHQLGMVDVNVRACVDLTGRLLPALQAQGGHVVNVASTAAFQPTPQIGVYGATKAFLLHWSLAMDNELRHQGVRSLAVCPGPTRTNFFKSAGFELAPSTPGSSQSSEAVVMGSLKALANGKQLYVSGTQNRLLVSLSGLLPKTWITAVSGWILRQVRDAG